MRNALAHSVVWLVLTVARGGAEAERPIPPAAGPHVYLAPADLAGVPSFGRDQRIVGTYYFYWYDSRTGAHLTNRDGTDALTTHPASLEDFSYQSIPWHRRQLEDMIAAGIDVVLPVFWGAPSEQAAGTGQHWSYAGLGPLVAAREELERAGRSPPRIGLFYDTSTLRHNRWRYHADLTRDYGRRWFYATVRDFFSLVPARHWAMIEGSPIVLLYSASFAAAHDQSVIDFTKAEFAREFGGRAPWIVREVSWRVRADSTVAWGGALGLTNPGVAALGPGYDHSAVPGRKPLVVARRDGSFYEENWVKFLRCPSPFVVIETWNEFHEGTDIAESREYGRRYLELTRKYTDRFKNGWKPEWPQGRFTGQESVSVALGAHNREDGVRWIDAEDGRTAVASAGGRAGRSAQATAHAGRYLYFAVDDTFKWEDTMRVRIEVEYAGPATGAPEIALEFDGSDASALFAGAYTRQAQAVQRPGDAPWRTAVFDVSGARFLGRQNRGADFRLVVTAPDVVVGRVTVRRLP